MVDLISLGVGLRSVDVGGLILGRESEAAKNFRSDGPERRMAWNTIINKIYYIKLN